MYSATVSHTDAPTRDAPGTSTSDTVTSDTVTSDTVTPHPVRVLVVDDHGLVRDALRDLLERQPDLEVTGEAATYDEAVTRLPLADPDVAIVDLQLPDGSGADLCRHIASHHPRTRSLVLSSFAHEGAVLAAAQAGAAGYVVKQVGTAELLDCIRRIAVGESLVDRRSHEAVRARARVGEADERLASLTPQERTLIELLADGLTNREIGERMHLSDKTVKNYVSNVLAKLGVTRRSAAAAYYERATARETWALDPDDVRRGPVRF